MPIEWVPIPLPQKLKVLDFNDFRLRAKTIELSREPDLWLRVSGSADGRFEEPEPAIAGTERKSTPIRLVDAAGRPCILDGYQCTHATVLDQVRSHIEGCASSLSVTLAEGTTVVTTEWVTNAPQLHWPGQTYRTGDSRTRGTGIAFDGHADGFSLRSDHFDLHLDLPCLSLVRVGTVPDALVTEGMSIARAGFIEFHRGAQGGPDEALRHTVRRALEFIFGHGLGALGSSDTDEAGRALSAVTRSALVAGGFGPPFRPALLHDEIRDGVDESRTAALVRRYVELEADYGLNRAVWLYLHGRNAPLEMAAGYVGAGLEVLRRGYYGRPENEPRSRLLPPKFWRELAKRLCDAVDSVSQLESWTEHRAELARLKTSALPGLNAVSGSRLNALLLKDLGLTTGEMEDRALQARNDAAHANDADASQNFERLRDYRAAHTLFARVLLRILGSDVRYFDYSSHGHPARELSEQQGGH